MKPSPNQAAPAGAAPGEARMTPPPIGGEQLALSAELET